MDGQYTAYRVCQYVLYRDRAIYFKRRAIQLFRRADAVELSSKIDVASVERRCASLRAIPGSYERADLLGKAFIVCLPRKGHLLI